jgi:hypothetical protein
MFAQYDIFCGLGCNFSRSNTPLRSYETATGGDLEPVLQKSCIMVSYQSDDDSFV